MTDNMVDLAKLLARRDAEATLYADTLLAKLRECGEMEMQYEEEMQAAARDCNQLICENQELKARVRILESLLRPTAPVHVIYPDQQ